MAVEIIHEPGAANANSFASRDEINAFLAERVALDPAWETTGDAAAQRIITAQRMITTYFSGRKTLIRPKQGDAYYIVSPQWVGLPANTTQSLPWPRLADSDGNPILDELGREIADDEIPTRLKQAQAELAGQLGAGDRLLDNDIIAAGLTAIKAGPVSLSFREDFRSDDLRVLPQAVFDLIPPSWYTAETVEYLTGTRPAKVARIWNL